LTTPLPVGEPMKIVLDAYEYASSPARSEDGTPFPLTPARLIKILVLAIFFLSYYCYYDNIKSIY
jgi:hypothetical protein